MEDRVLKSLSLDCVASYCEGFLSEEEADELATALKENFDVNNRDVLLADGSVIQSGTGSYLFAEKDLLGEESFPKLWGGRSAWTEGLSGVKARIEALTGAEYHVARAIYYEDGGDEMAFHSDLPAYGPTDKIASLSLGAERVFQMRKIDDHDEILSLRLRHGSLLFMGPQCQQRYEHGIPL
ncbi:alpha-ketoglutarate-dependent dioxygenase AlkB, partial [Akkermansiaceae bacterium]|nr:alpha-ketoglutarate-dependent dioxygenase AlkB [Akkermansiaceae bacterium]